MDGSSLIFIVMPIMIPIFLFGGIALPLLADGRELRRLSRGRAARAGTCRDPAGSGPGVRARQAASDHGQMSERRRPGPRTARPLRQPGFSGGTGMQRV